MRSRISVLVLFSAILLSVRANPLLGQETASSSQPNVLFVAIDDLNDWIEPLGGHPQAKTPNLNRLAREAMTFSRAYCPSPGCNPSRTAVMSGLAPYTSGVYSNYQDWREVIEGHQCIGAYFREHNYYSAGAGKIFHYHMVDPASWDAYWPSQEQNMPKEAMPDKTRSSLAKGNGEPALTMSMPPFDMMYGMFDWFPLSATDKEMGDYQSVDYIIDQLNQDHDRPFFLACGIYRPHLPWYVPQKYFDMFPLDEVELPRVKEQDLSDVGERAVDIAQRGGNYHQHVVEAGQWREAVQGYLASTTFADAMLGRLLDALESSPHANNTIVVVWSDHGWQLGEKSHWRKFALWENVVRSVLMIKTPEGSDALPEGNVRGAMCHRVVSLQDIYPTLVDLCGLPTNHRIDGRSLVPLLRDPELNWDYPAITTYHFSEFSIRNERWRYTIYIDGSEELYDHESDPEEWTNLAGVPEYQAIKREMASHVPEDPSPLEQTSLKLQPHHIPPFRSRQEYDEWIEHGKDMQYLIRKYWQ